MSNADPKALRVELETLQKKITKLINKQVEVKQALTVLEMACSHSWSLPYVDKKDSKMYCKDCSVCGQVKRTRNVTVKFD